MVVIERQCPNPNCGKVYRVRAEPPTRGGMMQRLRHSCGEEIMMVAVNSNTDFSEQGVDAKFHSAPAECFLDELNQDEVA